MPMFDVHLYAGVFVVAARPFLPKVSHSRFFMGNYCCIFMPEFSSRSQIERFVRKKVRESNNPHWTVKTTYNGCTFLYDEECEKKSYPGYRYAD